MTNKKSNKRKRQNTTSRRAKRRCLDLSDDEKTTGSDGKYDLKSEDDLIHRVGMSLVTTERCEILRGRENEHEKVETFLQSRLQSRKGGCLYIAGSPGTGKSALLHNLMNTELKTLQKQKKFPEFHVISFKATICQSVNDVYPKLLGKITDLLDIKKKAKNAHEAKDQLTEIILKKKKKKPMLVVVIDEVDALLSSSKGEKVSQRVLYHLFGLPHKARSSLILIGIANSIDLSQRFVPLLEQRGCGPELLVFEPYTEKQLITIIEEKLGEEGKPLFSSIALRFCAKKVSSRKGDCRQCLLLCRNALQILEENPEKKKVDFAEMKQVWQNLQNPMVKRISKLVFEHKKLLAIASILFQRKPKYSRGDLRSFYKHAVKLATLPGVYDKQFTEILDALIAQGFFTVGKRKKKEQTTSVEFQILELPVLQNDIKQAVQNVPCLKELMEVKMIIPSRFS